MSVVDFKRKTAKDEVLKILEEFDFDKGALLIYMDGDFEDLDSTVQILSTYSKPGIKECIATGSLNRYIEDLAFPIIEE